ncbi:4-oxalocrotonate tautomerase DmpI [bacterium]
MPNVMIDGRKIESIDAKRTLVKEVTDALEKAYKLPRSAYVIFIKESAAENVAVGGELISDR